MKDKCIMRLVFCRIVERSSRTAILCLSLAVGCFAHAKPFYLASSDSETIQFWQVDSTKRTYRHIASWTAPKLFTIDSISAYPSSKKLFVRVSTGDNRKAFTVSLSASARVSVISHGWIGYGYPLISPSERTVAVVGYEGVHGYLDLTKNRTDANLTINSKRVSDVHGAWDLGSLPDKGIHAVASWFKAARFQPIPFRINKYVWLGEKVVETIRINEEDTTYARGYVLDSDGSFLRADNNKIERVSGKTGNLTVKNLAKSPIKNTDIGPGPFANRVSLIWNSAGSRVLITTWGEIVYLSNSGAKSGQIEGRGTPAINTTGNGEVAMAASNGIRVGRWVGTRFYQTLLIPGNSFAEIEYLGPCDEVS